MLDPGVIEQDAVGAGVSIWFLGGPSMAIRSRESIIYLDLFTGPPPLGGLTKAIPEIIDPAAIARADLALSTHHDNDHCHERSLRILHENTTSIFLGPVSCNRLYQKWGFDIARTRLLAAGERFVKGDFVFHALPSNDAFDPDAVCYVLEVDGLRIFDAGDSLYFPQIAEIGQQFDLDVAFLSYAASPPGESYYMSEEGVLRAAKELNPRLLILKHYDLWQELGADPQPLLKRLRSAGHEARIYGLGERLDLRATAT
jgi:L-ascorbate metabolism protein UlaG (beta-lactamase superfamily)